MSKQISLFDNSEELYKHNEEWKNMPQFIQDDLSPFQSLIVHFETEQDRNEFAKLIEQKITYKTKSIWFPKYNKEKPSEYMYVGDSNE